MELTKYYIPGFDSVQFLHQLNQAFLPILSPYKHLTLPQRASLSLQVSTFADGMFGIDPEDRMDVIRFQNTELLKPMHREFIRSHHPYGVQDSFCNACGQTLPEPS